MDITAPFTMECKEANSPEVIQPLRLLQRFLSSSLQNSHGPYHPRRHSQAIAIISVTQQDFLLVDNSSVIGNLNYLLPDVSLQDFLLGDITNVPE